MNDDLERKILKDMETEGTVLLILFGIAVIVGITVLLTYNQCLC